MKKGKKYKIVISEFGIGESMFEERSMGAIWGFYFLLQLKPMSLAYRKLVSTQKIGELVDSLNLGRI